MFTCMHFFFVCLYVWPAGPTCFTGGTLQVGPDDDDDMDATPENLKTWKAGSWGQPGPDGRRKKTETVR